MITATVNELAAGVRNAWSVRVGEELEYVRPGLNRYHAIVRRPGERRIFGLPTRWLTMPEPEPAVVEIAANTTPLPEHCPTCGRELEES